jgi:hypothetical protein
VQRRKKAMATRKKKPRGGGTEPPDSGSRDPYTVVLEDLRSQFKVFGEGLQAVDGKVDRLDRRVTSGFERVDRGFDRVDRELGLVKVALLDHGRELREIRGALALKVDRDEVEAVVDRAVSRPR